MNAIGNTPLIKLNKLSDENSADIYVKFEGANPTGSMKDRMALAMIEGAEKRGELKRGYKVVEYTGGSTGSSLAMICANKGYKAHFVSSDGFAEEKIQTMRAFGATVEIIPAKNGKLTAEIINKMISRAKELIDEPNTFWTDQINNPDNKKGYYGMANEIISALGTHIDEFVMAVGGGGCISGYSEILKEKIPNLKTIAVEPLYVRNISSGDTSGTHKLEGIGLSFTPSILRKDLIDDIIAVSDEDTYRTARELAQKEGIFGGATSGANVWAAMQRAKILGPGKKIVTVICDSGLKYLQGDLYKNSNNL
ncbi:PLP-dependent cysteine synthase family protein [Flagellimonas lutimaris]|uniref:PLP-dependent cysteine synthase family protein n=1 Tax=Flagellimonas lutimaris TaxID=475082 RepID=UPI0039C21FDA